LKYFLALVCTLNLSLELSGQDVDSTAGIYTLQEVISITLEKNFDILIAKNNLQIARNNNSLGNAGFLPSLDVTGDLNYSTQNTEQEFVNGDEQSVDGAARDFYGASVDLNWTVFDGTRMFAVKDRLETSQILGDLLLKAQMENSLASTITLFYQLALEKERLTLFNNSREFSEERVRIIQQKYDVGKASKIELLQAEVDLNTDKSALIQQQQALEVAKYNLMQSMGISGEDSFDVAYQLNQDTTLQIVPVLEEAFLNNPLLLAEQANYEISKTTIKELVRGRFPEIDLNVGYGYSNLTSEAGFLFKNRTSAFNYGLTARVNLFNGFNTNREIQNASIAAENSELAYESLKLEIETMIRSTFADYQNNLALYKLERENREVARENAQIELDRFKLGVSDPLELRQAQNNAINATIRFLESAAEAKFAEIELKRLSGKLLTSE
jgi:outer membrane protein TolC